MTAIPPTIPGSLDVDTINVNKLMDVVGTIVGDALSTLNSWKKTVKSASTGALTLSGEQTVDGVALVAGDRVLVKDEGDATNGIYIVQEYAWVRADDMITGSSASGAAVYVNAGATVNGDVIYFVTNTAGSDVVGTATLVFASLTSILPAAGSDGQVQYNNGGVLGGATGFTFNDGTSLVTVPAGLTATTGDVVITAGDLQYTAATGGVNATMTNVSQATNITTAVTANGRHGLITTQSATTAGAASDTFTVNNSEVAATDIVQVSIVTYSAAFTTNGIPVINSANVGAGSFDIVISNAHATNALAGIFVLSYVVIKAV